MLKRGESIFGRKNSLFVGNEHGGRAATILSSLTSTCRRHGVDPQVYLTQLLANLPETPISQLDDWATRPLEVGNRGGVVHFADTKF
jgi:hypothetical protein